MPESKAPPATKITPKIESDVVAERDSALKELKQKDAILQLARKQLDEHAGKAKAQAAELAKAKEELEALKKEAVNEQALAKEGLRLASEFEVRPLATSQGNVEA